MTALPPIYSQYEHELSMRERVETFVAGLGEQIDELQDAELSGDFAAIHRAAENLVAGAKLAGYPGLLKVAERVIASSDTADPDEAQKGIIELTELAQRVRRGSRGAA
ncbi:MAG: hypothetical protein VX246_05625 [Myxococcota bacterium]|nr:hypothetical protein [Myxococcota bacterium]